MATIQHKRSTTAGAAPAAGSLSAGELAVNTADGKVFTKRDNGTVVAMALDADVVKLTGDQAVAGAKTFSGDSRFTSTGAITIPGGTIAQRPGTPAAGMMRHNTDSGRLEYYNGTSWVNFTVDALEVEYLVVAGGGGGTDSNIGGGSGGGGAGGFRTNVGGTALTLASGTSYTVIVGAGGAAATNIGADGGGSQFASILSAGGGGGGGNPANGRSGGSGGGGAYLGNGGAGNTPSTSPAQGTNGGNYNEIGTLPNLALAGGGGGGAKDPGGNGNAGTLGGIGGDGESSSISGSAVTYAGGGGGGHWRGGTETEKEGGTGGAGGGGKGGGITASVAGTVNTGGGGGGRGESNTGSRPGSAGGSGIVIVRYLGSPRAVGGTITAGTGSAAGYTIHTFDTSGTFALVV